MKKLFAIIVPAMMGFSIADSTMNITPNSEPTKQLQYFVSDRVDLELKNAEENKFEVPELVDVFNNIKSTITSQNITNWSISRAGEFYYNFGEDNYDEWTAMWASPLTGIHDIINQDGFKALNYDLTITLISSLNAAYVHSDLTYETSEGTNDVIIDYQTSINTTGFFQQSTTYVYGIVMELEY